MQRSQRLFQIVATLARHEVIAGKTLAAALGVTKRTIYRDVRELIALGTPIEGAAGVGYRLRRGYSAPPVLFTDDELQALHLGASILRSWSDTGLADAARTALAKVEMVLPATLRPNLAYQAIIVPGGHVPAVIGDNLSVLRTAIGARRKVTFDYPRPFAEKVARKVRPLALAYWGGSWTLGAWCETTKDFRTFRVDGLLNILAATETFADEAGLGLADYLIAARTHDAVLGEAAEALACI